METELKKEQGTPAQDDLEVLHAMLPALQKSKRPSQKEIRRIAKLLNVPQHGRNTDMIFRHIQMVFVNMVLNNKCRRGDCDASTSGGAHPAFANLLQEVLTLGRMPNEAHTPKNPKEKAEANLRRKIRRNNLVERMTRECESRGLPTSGGSHSAGNVSQIQTDAQSSIKRRKKKITLPLQVAPSSSSSGAHTLAIKRQASDHLCAQPPAKRRRVHKDVTQTTLQVNADFQMVLDIPDKDATIVNFVETYNRKPLETHARGKLERDLAHYIRKHGATLRKETQYIGDIGALEQAWRLQLQCSQYACATVNTLRKLRNALEAATNHILLQN